MQDLKPIRVFLEVAAQESFAGAAATLAMTPATVTRTIARLEADLGMQLLLRTTRQVSLTSAGALVAARYRPLVAEFDQLSQELSWQTDPHRGKLAINTPLSFGQRLMPSLISSFRLAYPNVELTVQLTDRFVDILDEDCDLAIRLSAPPTDKSTIWRKICQIPRHLMAAPRFFETHPRPQTPEDLRQLPTLSYSATGQPETWVLSSGPVKRSLTARGDILSNNGDFLCSMVEAGAGIALLPAFIAGERLRTGEIEIVLPEWTAPPLWLSLFYPPYEALPPLVSTFSDFFEAFLSDLGDGDFSFA